MTKFIAAIALMLGCGTAFAGPVDQWNKNYEKLVGLLKSTSQVGNCEISLSTDPNAPKGSWVVNFMQNPGGLLTFDIIPPAATHGRTQADLEPNHVLKYRSADVVGWVNMIVQIDDAENSIVGIKLNKTLPNGAVYEDGPACGLTKK